MIEEKQELSWRTVIALILGIFGGGILWMEVLWIMFGVFRSTHLLWGLGTMGVALLIGWDELKEL